MNIKIVGVVFISLLICNISVSAQNKDSDKVPFKERVYVGGALGFSVGNYSSLIDVSPIVGYAITRSFIAGIGLTYKYYRYNDYFYNFNDGSFEDFKTNMYGFSVWSRYFLTGIGIPIIENAFLHAEVEPLIFMNNYTFKPGGNYLDPFGNQYIKGNEQISLTSLFLGGGLRQMVGGRSYLYIEVLYNFNEDLYTPYSNPRIRIGFVAGF